VSKFFLSLLNKTVTNNTNQLINHTKMNIYACEYSVQKDIEQVTVFKKDKKRSKEATTKYCGSIST
jgi:hypothetical protein